MSHSQAIAMFSGKMSEQLLSPHHGSASVGSSFANSPSQASNVALTPPFSRHHVNVSSFSPASTATSVNQNSALTTPALGRSLPYSATGQHVPVPASRLPIRPVGPPPSQELLSSVGGSSSTGSSIFQSLVQV